VPTPTPTPSPTPKPTPTPTPTPTPAPTPTPTPSPKNVGNYTCQTLEVATTNIDVDEFALGGVNPITSGTPDNSWIVVQQDPGPGEKADIGSPINVDVGDPNDPGVQATCP
jgi:outer membrane biosynthesis protein TonB